MSTITATAWVPRGFAAAFPTKYVFDDDEYLRIAKLAKLQLEDAQEELDEAQGGVKLPEDGAGSTEETVLNGNGVKSTKGVQSSADIDDDLKEYDLEHYDDEDEETEGDVMGMFGNVKALAYHESNADDPYITLQDDEDEDDDREELQILSTDNLLLAAKIEDEVAHLEVFVYEDSEDNLYVHHDIMLPAIPLAVEWFDVPVGKQDATADSRGNFVAVGTMDPDIELWDLDTVDCMYPNAILGHGGEESKTEQPRKKRKKRSKKANEEYHVDAVLGLAANRQHRNLMASSSADRTVKLWDLNTTKCARSYGYHTDKVCALSWHPSESTMLLSGSYDRTVVAADMRAPEAKQPTWGVESDVEMVRCDIHNTNFFFVTTEKGLVHYHDLRNAPSHPSNTKPVWSLQAHDEAVSAFDINPAVPGFFVTGSTDKHVKLWSFGAAAQQGPSLVTSRNPDVGKVFSAGFAPDAEVAFRLAVAGSKNAVRVWDTSTNAAVRAAFAGRVAPAALAAAGAPVKDRLVGVAADSESDSDGDDLGDGGRGAVEDEPDGGEKDGWESMDED